MLLRQLHILISGKIQFLLIPLIIQIFVWNCNLLAAYEQFSFLMVKIKVDFKSDKFSLYFFEKLITFSYNGMGSVLCRYTGK